jgi:hypothetical protein
VLTGVGPPQPSIKRLKPVKLDLPPINIAAIGVVGYRRNLLDDRAIAFSSSLYEIDYLIKKKLANKKDDL